MLHELHSLTTVSVNIDEDSLLHDIEDLESLDAQADRLLQLLHGITNTKFLSFSAGAIHVSSLSIPSMLFGGSGMHISCFASFIFFLSSFEAYLVGLISPAPPPRKKKDLTV